MNSNSDDVDSSSKSQMLRLNGKLLAPSFCSKTVTKALSLWRLFFLLGNVYVLISWKQTDAIVERVTFRTEVILTHLVTFQKYQVSVGQPKMGWLGINGKKKCFQKEIPVEKKMVKWSDGTIPRPAYFSWKPYSRIIPKAKTVTTLNRCSENPDEFRNIWTDGYTLHLHLAYLEK